jgi:hypothetical protein
MNINVNLTLEPVKNVAFVRCQILLNPLEKGDFEKILVPPLKRGLGEIDA